LAIVDASESTLHGADSFREPEVHDPQEAVFADDDVLWFEIAVHDPALMRLRQARG